MIRVGGDEAQTSTIHPSIFVSGQQFQQGTLNLPFLGHINQLWLGDPAAFPGQCGDRISPLDLLSAGFVKKWSPYNTFSGWDPYNAESFPWIIVNGPSPVWENPFYICDPNPRQILKEAKTYGQLSLLVEIWWLLCLRWSLLSDVFFLLIFKMLCLLEQSNKAVRGRHKMNQRMRFKVAYLLCFALKPRQRFHADI